MLRAKRRCAKVAGLLHRPRNVSICHQKMAPNKRHFVAFEDVAELDSSNEQIRSWLAIGCEGMVGFLTMSPEYDWGRWLAHTRLASSNLRSRAEHI